MGTRAEPPAGPEPISEFSPNEGNFWTVKTKTVYCKMVNPVYLFR